MAYKKLSEATLVENVVEEATMLIEENDEIKRASVKDTIEKYGFNAGGGGGGNKIGLIGVMDSEITKNNLTYDELKNNLNMDIIILHGTSGNYKAYFPDKVLFDDATNEINVYFWDLSEVVTFELNGNVTYWSIG